MPISSKTRRILWAKSGNRCAICKTELASKKKEKDNVNIGEECHIISSKITGPRHKPGIEDYDLFENLILLCRNHHKEVDDQVDAYTEELLRYMKLNHENWVSNTLNEATDSRTKSKPRLLSRITSGKELLNIITSVHGYRTDYDECKNEDDADFIGGVIQELIDYGDISGMVESSHHVKMAFELSEILKNMDEKGYYLFAERNIEIVKFGNGESDKWSTATLIIKEKDNVDIIKTNLNEVKGEQ